MPQNMMFAPRPDLWMNNGQTAAFNTGVPSREPRWQDNNMVIQMPSNFGLQNLIVKIPPTPNGELLAKMAHMMTKKYHSLDQSYDAVKEAIFSTMGI